MATAEERRIARTATKLAIAIEELAEQCPTRRKDGVACAVMFTVYSQLYGPVAAKAMRSHAEFAQKVHDSPDGKKLRDYQHSIDFARDAIFGDDEAKEPEG